MADIGEIIKEVEVIPIPIPSEDTPEIAPVVVPERENEEVPA